MKIERCKYCGKKNIEIEPSIINKQNNVIYCNNCFISYISRAAQSNAELINE